MAYFTVQDWIVKDLKLKSVERDVFAIVYGITQDGESDYHGSLKFIAELTGYSRNSVCNALNSLTERGLLAKEEVIHNGLKYCRYRTTYLYAVQPTCTAVQPTCTNNKQIIKQQTILSKDSIVAETKSCQTETTTKKPNLYQKCIGMSEEYTENETLRKYLADFLKICLENSRESGRPFYQNMWKSKLTKLSELSENDDMRIKIVKQTLDNGWSNFYAYKENGRAGRQTGDFAKDVEHLSAGLNSRAERRDTSGEKF